MIPTAVNFLQNFSNDPNDDTVYEAMIEFAKLHCEAQRKDTIADLRKEHTSDSHIESIVNNAYPLTLIK
jgi:hypothetical protein